MLNWYIYEAYQRYEDRVREIEHDALVHNAEHTAHNTLTDRTIAGLGRLMVAWGERIQDAHSAPQPVNIAAGAGCTSSDVLELWSSQPAKSRRDRAA
jgi:hypothetical protein